MAHTASGGASNRINFKDGRLRGEIQLNETVHRDTRPALVD